MKKRAVWMALLMLCFALCFPALAEIPAEYASCQGRGTGDLPTARAEGLKGGVKC